MAKKNGLSYEQVEQALLDSRGIVSEAARKLGCSRQNVQYYIENYATCAKARDEARNMLVDDLENQLLRLCARGVFPAIKFALTNLGKDRGWGESIDINALITQVRKGYAEISPDDWDES